MDFEDITVKGVFKWFLGGLSMLVIFLFTLLGYSSVHKNYRVWSAEMDGKATLMEATQARQVLVQQAQAEKDAAQLRADAIAIVGKAAKEYPEYRQQEFIGAFAEALQHGNIEQIIYVPTEASIPIIEAK